MEIQTDCEVGRRRGLDEVELSITGRLVGLRVDTGVRTPPGNIACSELDARVASANLVRPRGRGCDGRRQLAELPELTRNRITHRRLEVRSVHRRAVAVGVGVNVAVAVGVGVNVAVAVGVGVNVAVAVGVGVDVAVAVGVGVGEGAKTPLTETSSIANPP